MAERQPVTHGDTGSSAPVDVVDIRHPRSFSNVGVVLSLLVLVMIILSAEVFLPKNKQKGREALPGLYGMCIFFATTSYLVRYLPIIRIDQHGVAAHRRRYHLRATTVPWDEILSCDLVEVRSRLGTKSAMIPILKDSAGKVLFPNLANLLTVPRADQLKVLQALKPRFGKLDSERLAL